QGCVGVPCIQSPPHGEPGLFGFASRTREPRRRLVVSWSSWWGVELYCGTQTPEHPTRQAERETEREGERMPTPKGRNRKARRAAAAFVKSAADPPVEEEVGSSSKAAAVEGSKSAASHEKQRRQRQRQQQQLESSNKKTAVSVVAPGALPGVQGSTSKGKDSSGKKKDNVAGTGTARNGKKKDPATTGGEDGGNIADLDADDLLSGGFMSMAGIPNDEHKAGRELEGGGGGGGDDSSSGDNDGVDGSSSDDEDDEGGDGGVVGEDESDSDDEDANASAMDLKGLAETDPEFYSFLQKEEPTLLEFDPMDSDDSEDEDGDG
ncbi:unnamed protein product, partial [Ectocarpus fasciculatus]